MPATTFSPTRPEGESITIPAAKGGRIALPAPVGGRIVFTHDISGSAFERHGNDLVIAHADGGSVTLTDFFVQDEGAAPGFVLRDGTVIDSADFLRAENPDLDLTTAAGPASAPGSSGMNAYADASGSLVGGLDRLDSLGTDQWARQASGGRDPLPFAVATALVDGDIPGGFVPQFPSAPGTRPDPTPEPAPTPDPAPTPAPDPIYGRMVMYINDSPGNSQLEYYMNYNAANGTNYQFDMVHQAQSGGADASVAPLSRYGYGTATFDAEGRLIYTTTADGLLALNDPANNGRIYDYVTYVDADGQTRIVEVVLTSDTLFATGDAEGNAVDQETHFSYAGIWTNTAYNIVSTGGDDVLELESAISRADLADGMNQTAIRTGGGNDSITVTSGFKSANALLSYATNRNHDAGLVSIATGEGDDTLNLIADNRHLGASATNAHGYHAGGGSWSGDGRLDVSMGEGDDVMNVTVRTQGTASGILDYNNDGTRSIIDLGAGGDSLNIDVYGARYATGLEYGVTVRAGDGDDTVRIAAAGEYGKNYALQGEGSQNQRPILEMGAGNDSLHLSGTTDRGDARGANGSYIYLEEGNDTLSVQATATGTGAAYGLTSTLVDAGAGNDSISIVADSVSGASVGMSGGSVDLGGTGDSLAWLVDGNGYNNMLFIHGGTTGISGTSIRGSAGNDYVLIEAGTGNAIQGASVIDLGAGDDRLIVKGNMAGGHISLGSGDNLVEIDGMTGGSIAGDGNDTIILRLDGQAQGAFTATGAFSGLLSPEAALSGFGDIILDMSGNESDSLEITGDMIAALVANAGGSPVTIHITGDSFGSTADQVDASHLESAGWTTNIVDGHTEYTSGDDANIRIIIENGLL